MKKRTRNPHPSCSTSPAIPQAGSSNSGARPKNHGATLALFPGIGEAFDGASEETIDLSVSDVRALRRAAERTGSGVLMMMANTTLGRNGGHPKGRPDGSKALGGITIILKNEAGAECARFYLPPAAAALYQQDADKAGRPLGTLIEHGLAATYVDATIIKHEQPGDRRAA